MSERIQIAELHPDICLRTYGVGECDAVLGTTGQRKCFGTRITCQDPANYKIRGSVAELSDVTVTATDVQMTGRFTVDAWVLFGAASGSVDVFQACEIVIGCAGGAWFVEHGSDTDALIDPPADWFRLRIVRDGTKLTVYYNNRVAGTITTSGTYDGPVGFDPSGPSVSVQSVKIWHGLPIQRPEIIDYLPDAELAHHWSFVEGTGLTIADRRGGPDMVAADTVTWSDGDTKSVNVLRHSRNQEGLPRINLVPDVDDVSLSPSRINLGGTDATSSAIGLRATCDLSLLDAPHHDRGVDPYARERVSGAAQADAVGYDPNDRGTYWTKFLARNPYYEGRTILIRDGAVGDDLGDMEVREYLWHSLAISSGDTVAIQAVDVLTKINIDAVQVPPVSQGILTADITSGDSGFTLSPSGVGATYAASGYYTLGDESGLFTRSGDVITFGTRGILGTVASEHKAGDTFQESLYYDEDPTIDVCVDLLSRGGVPSSYYDVDYLNENAEQWLGVYVVSRFIPKPTNVLTLFASLIQEASCYSVFDEQDRQIIIDQVRPLLPGDTVHVFADNTSLLKNATAVTEKPDLRVASVVINSGIRSPLLDDKRTNYRTTQAFIDGGAISVDQYGGGNTLEIFSRWLTTADAYDTGLRMSSRFRDTPMRIMFSLTREEAEGVAVGDICQVTTRKRVDETGLSEEVIYQIIERNPGGATVKFLAQDYPFSFRYGGVISPNDAPDYDVATTEQRALYAYITDENGLLPDGSTGHVIL